MNWQHSLNLLLDAIPPPAEPKYVEGPLLDTSLPAMPDDHAALVRAYGSGEFSYGRVGCVIEVFNPRDPWHQKQFRELSEILREYRESEGDEYMPFSIYPDHPGALICGWNDSSDQWFWYVDDSDPNQWPTVFYGDMQDSFQFEMPMVIFMQKLFFGEISRRQLNFGEPDFKSTGFEFRPTWREGSPMQST